MIKRKLKSPEISQKALIELDSQEERQYWFEWIKKSICRRESKEKPAFRHINWLKEILRKFKVVN